MATTPGAEEPRRYEEPRAAEGPVGQEGNGLAIAALVLGILAILGALITGFLGIILGIPAVILGVLGRRKVKSGRTTQGGGLALAGIITGALGIVIGIVVLILAALVVSSPEFQEQFQRELERQQQQE